jgi:hypothetical protein
MLVIFFFNDSVTMEIVQFWAITGLLLMVISIFLFQGMDGLTVGTLTLHIGCALFSVI